MVRQLHQTSALSVSHGFASRSKARVRCPTLALFVRFRRGFLVGTWLMLRFLVAVEGLGGGSCCEQVGLERVARQDMNSLGKSGKASLLELALCFKTRPSTET